MAKAKPAPSLERLREVLSLDPSTGVLTWKISLGSRAVAGNRAGYLHSSDGQGYRWVRIDGVVYREHLIIWFMLTGEWLPRQIDHRDRNRANNRPDNLRRSTESQQRQNTALRSDNTSGHRGVRKHNLCDKYQARIYVDGKEKYLGLFASLEEAAEAARAARLQHYGQFAPSYDQTR